MSPTNGGAVHRRIAILAVVASTLLLMGLSAGQALAGGDDNIPGIPIGPGTTSGVVDVVTDPYDVYSVKLFDGEQVGFALRDHDNNSNYSVSCYLLAPEVTSINDSWTALLSLRTVFSNEDDGVYTPAKDGVYHILIRGGDGYSLTISGSAEVPPSPSYLRLRTSATKVRQGRSVTLSAKLVNIDSALIPGYSVNLFRSYNGRSWTKVKSMTSTTGAYSTRARIVRKTWFRMKFAGNATWSSCRSRAVTISVR